MQNKLSLTGMMIVGVCVAALVCCGDEGNDSPGSRTLDGRNGGPGPSVYLADAGSAVDTAGPQLAVDAGGMDTGTTSSDPAPDADPNNNGQNSTPTPSEPTDPPTDPVGTEGNPGLQGAWTVDTLQEKVSVANTALSVDIYLPSGTGPYPTVLFLPGFQLTSDLYESYGQHLASWGYVTLIPDLPGSPFTPTPHSTLATYTLDLLDWVATSPGGLAGKADATNMALTGHSLGGKIAMLASMNSPVVTAVFGVDPVDAVPPFQTPSPEYPSVTPEMMNQLGVPLGMVGETTNAVGGTFGMSCAPAEDNFEQYYAHATVPVLAVEMVGANHMSFLDNPNCGMQCTVCTTGTDDSATTRYVTRRTMTAFFRRFLNGDNTVSGYLNGAEIEADVNAGLVVFQAKNGF